MNKSKILKSLQDLQTQLAALIEQVQAPEMMKPLGVPDLEHTVRGLTPPNTVYLIKVWRPDEDEKRVVGRDYSIGQPLGWMTGEDVQACYWATTQEEAANHCLRVYAALSGQYSADAVKMTKRADGGYLSE